MKPVFLRKLWFQALASRPDDTDDYHRASSADAGEPGLSNGHISQRAILTRVEPTSGELTMRPYLRPYLMGLLFVLLMPFGAALAVDCGAPPATPAPPPGCRALRPLCLCDYTGVYCHWLFMCEP